MKCLWFSFPRFCDSLKRGCVQRREKPNDILGSLIRFEWGNLGAARYAIFSGKT